MNKHIGWCGILFVVLMTSVVWAGSEDGANQLFTEASQWAATAQKTEVTSYTRALEQNEKALAALERIIKEYGKGAMATKLLKGEVKIGGYTYTEFKDMVVRSRKNRLWAEGNLFGAALLMAKQVTHAQEQRELITQVIQEYWNYAKKPSEEILAVAFETAQAVREPKRKLQALLPIAEKASVRSPEITAIVHEMERESFTEADSLIAAAELYALAGKYDLMVERLQQAAKRTKDPLLTRRIAEGLAVAKQYDGAVELARKYGTSNEKDDALLGVIAKAAENGDYAKATPMLDKLGKTQAKCSGWIHIAVGYAKNGNLSGALQLLKHLTRPDEQMEMLHEIGYYYKSEATAEVYRQIDALPNASMKVQVLLALFENYYFRTDVGTGASTVLKRCYEILKTARVYEENPGLVGALVQNFGLLRQTEMMVECYTLLLKALGTPSMNGSRIEVVAELLDNCSEYLPTEIFLKLIDQTVHYAQENLNGVALRCMINVAGQYYREAGQATRGLQVVKGAWERPSEAGMEVVTAQLYVTAAQCALDLGDGKKAGEMAQQAYELVRKVPGYPAMRELFEVYCDLGDVERVKELMTQAKEYENFYVTWLDDLLRTAEGCSRWGRWEQAVKVVEEMLAQRTDKRDAERSEILGGLAREYAKRKDYTRVKQIVEEMQDEDAKFLTLAQLASIGLRCADEKLLSTTVELARKMSVSGCGQTLLEIAVQYAQGGRYEQAFTLVEMIRDPLAKSQALLQLGVVYAEKGKAVDEVAKKHLRKLLSGE